MLIIHAKIHTMAGHTILDGSVRVKGAQIDSVGSGQFVPEQDEQVLDAKGADLYPGFLDAHTHIGMWEDALTFEGDDGNEETNPVTPQLRAIDAINPMDRCFRSGCSRCDFRRNRPGQCKSYWRPARCDKDVWPSH